MFYNFTHLKKLTSVVVSSFAIFLVLSCSSDSGNGGGNDDDTGGGGSNTLNMEAYSPNFNVGTGFRLNEFSALAFDIVPQGNKFLVSPKKGSTYNGTSVGIVCRLNADGSMDTSFNTSNTFKDVTGDVHKILLLSDGKILVGGRFTVNNAQETQGIAVLNNDGSLDTSFNVGGSGLYGNGVFALAEDSQGRIYVGGLFSQFNGVNYYKNFVCFNRNGSVNSSFQLGTGFTAEVDDIEFADNGKIWVCGRFSKYNDVDSKYLVVLNADGTPDKTFDIFSQNALMTHGAYDIALQDSGKAIVVGAFKCNGKEGIARINANGTYDESFEYTDFLSDVWGIWPRAVTLMNNDEIVIGGDFDDYIVVLTKDGAKHNGFNPTLSFNGYLSSVYVSPEGYIYAAGSFTTYEDIPSGGVARLRGKQIN